MYTKYITHTINRHLGFRILIRSHGDLQGGRQCIRPPLFSALLFACLSNLVCQSKEREEEGLSPPFVFSGNVEPKAKGQHFGFI